MSHFIGCCCLSPALGTLLSSHTVSQSPDFSHFLFWKGRKLSVTLFLLLKGVWQEILDFRFFSWISFHWSLRIFLTKIRGDIRNFVFISGVNDNDNKVFTVVNDTSNKLSLVSLLPAIIHCRCRWHRWLGLVPDFHRFKDTYNNNKQRRQHVNKIWKTSCFKIFSHNHRCRWSRWLTFTFEYLREFS